MTEVLKGKVIDVLITANIITIVLEEGQRIQAIGYDYDELRALLNTQVVIEVTNTEGQLVSNNVKPLVFQIPTSGELANLVVDYDKTKLGELTLDAKEITDVPKAFTAYCVKQERVTTLKSNYYAFELKDKYSRTLKATLFVNAGDELVDMAHSIIIVTIFRKGIYYNIESIKVGESIVLSDPVVEMSKEFIRKAYKDDNIAELLEYDLTSEMIIKWAYQLNLLTATSYMAKLNRQKLLEALAYEKYAYVYKTYKDVNVEELNEADRRICNAIKAKYFTVERQAYFSEGSEVYKLEKALLRSIIVQADLLYKNNYVYDDKVVNY